ncbi:hypothetical protein EIK77_001073 [Talaromyces pinophilus]|nr:hypothetical protein EIK77_001073 [Talaromyces pinophilus]
MQVAEILSDLTSLRACVSHIHSYFKTPRHRLVPVTNSIIKGHNEALALVNVHKPTDASAATADGTQQSDQHAELSRAQELVDLHYGVKVKHMGSAPNFEPVVDAGLRRAREDVNRVLRELDV